MFRILMDFHLSHILVFLIVAIATSHAVSPPEEYWDSVLPNTPMPKAISDLLHPDFLEEKGTAVNVGKGGVNVNTGNRKPGGTAVNVGKGGVNVNTGKGKPGGTAVNVGKGGVNVNTGKGKPGGTSVNVGKGGVNVHTQPKKPGTTVNVGRKGVGVNTKNPKGGTSVGVGKGGVNVHTGGKGKPVYVGVKPGKDPFVYNYKASEDQLQDNPNVALFFLEKDLQTGKSMNLHFTRSADFANFVPRETADSIPFSSNKLPEIYSTLSVQPDSTEAEIMKNTIQECEAPAIKGEEKHCATSLESMVDFTTSKLGKNVQAISTEVGKETPMQKYTIETVKKAKGEKSVVCHKQDYVYAVFYCHKTETTESYEVSMVGADGSKVKAVAVCHTDTSGWNPKHLAFQVLKVEPGTVPVCHFLPQDHIVWVNN